MVRSRCARKAGLADADLVTIVERAERGLNNGDLGGSLYKMRVGTKGAYRTILTLVVEGRAVFLAGYAKADLGNVGDAALAAFKANAASLLRLSDKDLDRILAHGELREIPR